MNAKSRTILLITSILIIFSISILAVVKIQQDQEIKFELDKYFKNLKISYKHIYSKYEDYYSDIVLNLFNAKGLKNALKDKDKTQVYKLFLNQYIILKKQNRNLLNLNFYTPDNDLLLSMNQNSKINKGDSLIKELHKTKQSLFSVSTDSNNVIFKSIHPIFYGGEYIACVELSISAKYLLDDMKKYLNLNGFMFSSESESLYYNTMKDMLLLSKISKNEIHNSQKKLETRKGKIYSTYIFTLENKIGINVARLYFFNDITNKIKRFDKSLSLIFIFLISMIIITVIIVSLGVSRSLNKLQNSFNELNEYTDMIDSNIIMIDTNKNGMISSCSKRFCEVSGYEQGELVGKLFKLLKEESVDEKIYDDINKSLEKDGKWFGEIHNVNKYGEEYWLSTKIESKIKDNKFISYNYIMHNITDRKKAEELIFIDELTSLYNRKFFNDAFFRMVNGIKRNGGCINFVVVNIDDFSKYNEEYGIDKADIALVRIAEKLTQSLRRPDDYCFRLSGGEFGILFRSENKEKASTYTQVLRKNIEMLHIEDKTNLKFKVMTTSLGLASFMDKDIINEKDIYDTAYRHLSRAKEDGKNKVIYKLV